MKKASVKEAKKNLYFCFINLLIESYKNKSGSNAGSNRSEKLVPMLRLYFWKNVYFTHCMTLHDSR